MSRTIGVSIALRRMRDEGITISAPGFRKVLAKESGKKGGIHACQLGDEGHWHIETDSFELWLEGKKSLSVKKEKQEKPRPR